MKKLSLKSFFWTLSENGVLTIPAKISCWVAVILLLIVWNWTKERFISQKHFPPKVKVVKWNSVWTMSLETCCQRPKNFRSMSEKNKNFCSCKFIILLCSYGKQNAVLKTTPKNSCKPAGKNEFKAKVIWKIYIDFLKKILSPKCYLGLRWRKEIWRPGQKFLPGGL